MHVLMSCYKLIIIKLETLKIITYKNIYIKKCKNFMLVKLYKK